ncbi:DEAD/DEAH box helicase family protein [Pseudomonas sp. ML2-2023-6]|uniref:DEAD/DEAH box helicase family protein n=1 Tax=Pseudomonas sp. ML2-2023-6 TaxID=3122376 RepID=UPI0030CF3491
MTLNLDMYADNLVYKSWVDNPLKVIAPSAINNNFGFRKPQMAAVFTSLAHLISSPAKPATVVMPTGTGKTDTIIAIVLAGCFERTLVVVPSDALRRQTADKFLELKNLRKMGAIGDAVLAPVIHLMSGSLDDGDFDKIIARLCT